MKRIISLLLFMSVIMTSISGMLTVSAAYKNTYTNTGKGQIDIAEVAKTQVGYYEGMEQVQGYHKYTKYGDWYHDYMNESTAFIDAAWCAMFVSWCSYQAGTIEKTGSFAYCPYWVSHFKEIGKWKERNSGYIPVEGDIIFFADNGTLASHVGIVYESNRSTVYTIEGNTEDSCKYRLYSLNDAYILGYGIPDYEGRINGEVPEIPTPVPGEKVYITGYNSKITWGAAVVFDKKFNGTNSATYNELGIAWSAYLVAEPTLVKGTYCITLIGEHLNSGSLTIPEGGIIFASHCDDRDENSNTFLNSRANKAATTAFEVGDYIKINGVDFKTGAVSATATVEKTNFYFDEDLEPGSEYVIDRNNNYLLGVKEECNASYLISQFNSNVTVTLEGNIIGTGSRIFVRNIETNTEYILTIVTAGDLSGDGMISPIDYILAKRSILGTIILNNAQYKAGCLSGGNISQQDYIILKRHIIGTLNLYKN